MLCLLGCKAKPVAVDRAPVEEPPARVSPAEVGHVSEGTLVMAEVVTVLPPVQSEAQNPCAETSCRAEVKIIEVMRRGNGPASRLRADQQKTFEFVYTLAASSAGYFPDLRIDYPGLRAGDRFEAVVDGVPAVQTPFRYLVKHYVKT